MGHSSERNYIFLCRQFNENYHLKRFCKLIAELMDEGFTNHDYIEEFKYTLPHIWARIEEKCAEDKRWYKARSSHKKKLYSMTTDPTSYLLKFASGRIRSMRNEHKKGNILDKEVRDKLRSSQRNKLINKHNKNTIEQSQKDAYLQTSTPEYTNYYIRSYFYLRKRYPDDFTSRCLILHEAAKYKCEASITFLHQVNNCDRNYNVRKYAYLTLRDTFGLKDVRLGRHRKGKVRRLDNEPLVIFDSPEELLTQIYESPLERMKKYDLFLSHSFRNKEDLLKMKAILNSSNLNIYLDWVNDKDELLREKSCTDTAKVLTERIKACKAILYIHTPESLDSKWTPWELGFASALGKPIYVYYLSHSDVDPEYLQLYKEVTLIDNDFRCIDDNARLVDLLKN